MARKTQQCEQSPDSTTDEALTGPADAIDPYAILALDKSATQDQVKTAYRKAALKNHPDKAKPELKEEANRKFQEIATAYAILSDERRRRRYDATGSTAESLDDDDFDWTEFFRQQSQNMVNAEMIEQIKNDYQGSEEERADVLQAYEEGEGNMDLIYETIICSNVLDDDARFRGYIDSAIASKEVQTFTSYTRETTERRKRRLRRAKDEEQEAMSLAEELGVKEKLFGEAHKKGKQRTQKPAGNDGGDDALKALIQQRQQSRSESFFDQLEAKYGGGKKSKRKAMDEPPEELFSKNAKRSKARK